MRMVASPRRDVVLLLIVLVAVVAGTVGGSQQPKGEPFSTAIMRLKEGLYVIPGWTSIRPFPVTGQC